MLASLFFVPTVQTSQLFVLYDEDKKQQKVFIILFDCCLLFSVGLPFFIFTLLFAFRNIPSQSDAENHSMLVFLLNKKYCN